MSGHGSEDGGCEHPTPPVSGRMVTIYQGSGYIDVHAYPVTPSVATRPKPGNRDVEAHRTLLRESLTSAPSVDAVKLLEYVLTVFNIKSRTYDDHEKPLILHVAREFGSAFANASNASGEASWAMTGKPNTARAADVFNTSLGMLFNESMTAYQPIFPTARLSLEGKTSVIDDISQLLGESLRLSIPRSKSGYY